MTPAAATNPYKHHRFPGEIISHAVWLYFRFCLGLVKMGTSNRLARLEAVTLLGGNLAVPDQDGVGLRNRGDLFQRLPAQLLVNLG